MKPAIEVKGISKSYIINHQNKPGYNTLKDDIGNIIRSPFTKSKKFDQEKFWALNDISFEVNKGEIFGIIGRNGSGKSTLLKILSRIVDPSKGSITMRGRTASLLEVGTGFHPELTGRENVYLNGSMLGMSRQEIKARFDEIVDFSEIERFIDTPVKFYSSGMYVRLAFAVAAHLEPDILILDEVLSVGDAGFQKKSLKKIQNTMEEGRTVLFVSHSMGSVRQLCSRGVLLRDGRIDTLGDSEDIIARYDEIVEEETGPVEIKSEWTGDDRYNNEFFDLEKIYIVDSAGKKVDKPVQNDQDHWFCIDAKIKKLNDRLNLGYAISNTDTKTRLYTCMSTDSSKDDWPKLKLGKTTMRAKIPKHLLNSGSYRILFAASIHNKEWLVNPDEDAPSLDFLIGGGLSQSPFWKNPREGVLAPIIKWTID